MLLVLTETELTALLVLPDWPDAHWWPNLTGSSTDVQFFM